MLGLKSVFLTHLLVNESVFEPNILVSSSQLESSSTRIKNLTHVEHIGSPTSVAFYDGWAAVPEHCEVILL